MVELVLCLMHLVVVVMEVWVNLWEPLVVVPLLLLI